MIKQSHSGLLSFPTNSVNFLPVLWTRWPVYTETFRPKVESLVQNSDNGTVWRLSDLRTGFLDPKYGGTLKPQNGLSDRNGKFPVFGLELWTLGPKKRNFWYQCVCRMISETELLSSTNSKPCCKSERRCHGLIGV